MIEKCFFVAVVTVLITAPSNREGEEELRLLDMKWSCLDGKEKKYKKQKEYFLQMYKRKKVVKVIYTHSIITVLCQNSSILMLGLKEQSCSFTSVHAVQ